MRTYPRKPRAAFWDWCRAHEEVFTEHGAAIGVSHQQLEAFMTAVSDSRKRVLEQDQAQEAARAATQRAKDAFDRLDKAAGSIVRSVRAFAQDAEHPTSVYATAKIAPPGHWSPKPPPAQPARLAAALDPTFGHLTLRWNCKNPSGTTGTSYLIRRRLPGETEFSFIGVAGTGRRSGSQKVFIDRDLPAGSSRVEYVVQGHRGQLAGPASDILVVNIGKRPGGGKTATVTTSTAAQPNSPAHPAVLNVEIPAPTGNGRSRATSR